MSIVKYLQNFLAEKNRLDDMERNGEESYSIQFLRLRELNQRYKDQGTYPTKEGEKLYNVQKNRYKDILPYDHCRVALTEILDIAGSDYINASFIKGAVGNQQYIAAQGPLLKTVIDFWRMIWENNVNVVVMACQEYEGTPPKLKCQRYWAVNKDEQMQFGDITVSLIDEIPTGFDEYVIRRLSATKDNKTREIMQFHYLNWPDKFIPKCIDSIMSMIKTVRKYQPLEKQDPPPLLVHCSAGCGRTGTILVIDYVLSMLKFGKLTKDFSLFDVITVMRQQRMAIVQSVDQYVFVHEVIAELFKKQMELIERNDYSNVVLPTESKITDESYEPVDVSIPPPRKPDRLNPDVFSAHKEDSNPENDGLYAQPLPKKKLSVPNVKPTPSLRGSRPALPIVNTDIPKPPPPSKPVPKSPSSYIGATAGSGPYFGTTVVNIGAAAAGGSNNVPPPDYIYADVNKDDKWSLQAIALGKNKTSNDTILVENAEYATVVDPPSTNSPNNMIYTEIGSFPAADYISDDDAPPVPTKMPGLLASPDITNRMKLDIPVSPRNPVDRKVSLPNTNASVYSIKYKGFEIGYPHRVGKPKGKRPLTAAAICY